MNPDRGSWRLSLSLGVHAPLGMASAMFIALAATRSGLALLSAISGSASPSWRHRSFSCFSTRRGQFSSLSSSRRR